jgi:hypothetical protein
MNNINLEEIFNNNFDCYTIKVEHWKEVEEPAMSKECFVKQVNLICKKLLELTSENANVKKKYTLIGGPPEFIGYGVDKQSILNTISQIK